MRPRSLLGQIVVSAGSGVLIFVGIWTAAAIFWLYSNALAGLETSADSQSRELSAALAPLVWNLDSASIQDYLDTKVIEGEIVSIRVDDPAGGHLWSAEHRSSFVPVLEQGAVTTTRQANILYSDQTIGHLTLTLTLAPRQRQVAESVLTLVLSLFLLFIAILFSIALSWRSVSSRLKAMVEAMEEFSSGDGSARMDIDRSVELGILCHGFNTMADRIQKHTHSMEQEIRERTERLMESEKLALVGSLVAGVAHEINTPIGNGITVSSWLVGRTKELREAHAAGGPSQEALASYLTDVESSLAILVSGLDRTSTLIQSFKKIGADQVVDERRPLPIETFLSEVVTSLWPTFKRSRQEVKVDCPDNFVVESHPGALFQIVTNLVLNAHHHAFPTNAAGVITLRAEPYANDRFRLSVQDNGVGMDEAVQTRAFQPFFTTKRLEGGTGLGLSIVLSLVQKLGGTIDVESAPGAGSTFIVDLPRVAPDQS